MFNDIQPHFEGEGGVFEAVATQIQPIVFIEEYGLLLPELLIFQKSK